jgi:DNA-binding CsgD family transcriptional regulator
MRALEAAGLLGAGRMLRNEPRDVIRNSMTFEERTAISKRAAHLLRACNAPAQVVARQLISANCDPAPWMAVTFRTAAEGALAADDASFATALLRMAYRACTDPREQSAIRLCQVSALWRIDPSAAARYLPEVTAAAHDGKLDTSQLFTVCHYLLWFGHTDEAIRILRLTDRPRLGKEMGIPANMPQGWLRYCYPDICQRFANIASSEPVAREWLFQFGTFADSFHALAAIGLAAALAGESNADAAISDSESVLSVIQVSERTITSALSAISAMIYTDTLDKAASWCQKFLSDAKVRRVPTWHALFAALRATIEFRTGHLAAAEHFATEALRLVLPRSWGVAIALPVAPLVLARTAAGRYDEAADALKMPPSADIFQTPYGLLYLHARGHYYLATGITRAAFQDFKLCGDLITRWQFDVPGFIPWRSDAAWALLAMGETSDAQALVAEQQVLVRAAGTRTLGLTLRASAAANPECALRLLWCAIDALKDGTDKLGLSLTFADLSRVYQAQGDYRRALSAMRAAHHIAERCGAKLPEEVSSSHDVAEDHGDSSHGIERLLELTDSERRVAMLAATGDTNHQIAEKLHITVSTVEQHLTRSYRKLGVRSRADLPVELHLDRHQL